jgi:CIC family chloride channel protein
MIVMALDVADRAHRLAPATRAAIVAAAVGLIAYFAPWLVGGGETLVQGVLDGGQSAAALAFLLAVRLLLGPLSYAPGLPGGLFAPLLVVGAAFGALFGLAAETAVPLLMTPMAGFAAVGMGALFTAVVRAPVTGITLVVEMTGETSLFVPLLTACAAAAAVPTALGAAPIYDSLSDRDRARRSGVATGA